ncbi:MAG: undecaprenyl/decaprenyl-phosphate alpha-N-acetylglucosaminyl 1-phosphate transferase [Anaerolineae bacterium]|nr:undecaprenyl/decaprenyl-phosphate alpha-N-acetylglucosaminyl 1-phosphate transferase [Anaerolineae bacterium]
MEFVPIMIAGFLGALLITPLARRAAWRFGVVDQPSGRKVHTTATPLMGGLAIYAGMVLALFLFSPRTYLVETLAIGAGASWMALIGLIDDRQGMSFRAKLLAQLVAALVVAWAGIQIKLVYVPAIDLLLTVFWIVALTNAVNFLDNMDGLAAGLTGIAAAFFFILAAGEGQGLVSSLAAAIAGAALGFLIFNFNPASIFMGDMGSQVLGFILAVLAIKLRFATAPGISTWSVPLLVLGLPIFDISLVVFTRLREGRSPAEAGKDHTSHRLNQMGLSPRRTVLVLYGVCIAFGLDAIVVNRLAPNAAEVIVIITLVVVALAFIGLEYFRIQQQKAGKL